MVGRGWVAFCMVLALSAPALAAPPLLDRGEAPALRAWKALCERQPEECRVDLSQPEKIVLTQDTLDLVDAVNRHVNSTVTPITDRERWGVEDLWDYPSDQLGDCEDYQLLKRRLLAEAGLPRRAMRMTVVINELGEGHAVLTIRTTSGNDLVLDNRNSAILRWDQTGYAFVKRESAVKTGWVFIEPDAGGAVVTAAAQ
jgi:predicted transglutaminase-like cysteine proteinase